MTSATLLGALATAGVLGFTHAIEPDHVAGISSLAGEAGDSRLSAVVGACFSLGHVALVVVWLGVMAVLSGQGALPSGLDAVGTVGAALLLGGLGTLMAVGGLRTVVRTDEHSHGDVTHEHPHLHLPLPGVGGHGDGDHDHGDHDHGDHDHGIAAYLKTGLLGALFTLSPPLSMIAFAGTLFPQYGLSAVSLAVVVYAVAITATMSAIGAGVGTAFGTARTLDARAYGAVRTVAGAAVVALAGGMLASTLPLA
jgi:nickel/cobalt exporter